MSGGVDSTYVAYLVKKQFGLRPLAVHVDNGWDSELAVKNIEQTLKKLDIDLYTKVLDWEEFKDFQLSFFKASAPDGEHSSDHAYQIAVLDKASEEGIRYIVRGTNLVTEAIMPVKWSYRKRDWKYLKNIQKTFGTGKLRNYPHVSLLKWEYYSKIKKIEYIPILNYAPENKQRIMKKLRKEIGWKYYGGKHYESIYTRFWQGYILPKKFNIDK